MITPSAARCQRVGASLTGHFLELEVVLAEGEPSTAGVAGAQAVMDVLGIAPGQLVEGAYVELLARQHA